MEFPEREQQVSMNIKLLTIFALALFLSACLPKAQPAPDANPEVSATPGFGVIADAPQQILPVGAEIQVYWRERQLTETQPVEFKKHGTLRASPGVGRVSGSLILAGVGHRISGKKGELRAISVSPADKPDESFSGISVDASDDEYYDNYICRDENGTLLLFLEFDDSIE